MPRPSDNVAEGRAISARPSLYLAVVGALLLPLLAASAAQAEQPERVALTETNPLSSAAQPATSTTPFIIGRGDGAIISVAPFGARISSPIASTVNPDNEVEIYANGTCADSPVAIGIIDELEGEGIEVEVEVDSTTTFSAIQIDPADPGNPSVCSKPITYWQSSTGGEPPDEEPPAEEHPKAEPPAPKPPASNDRPVATVAPVAPRLETVPGSPANDNTPRLTGSAEGADTVRIFANASCGDTPIASVSPRGLSAGVELRVADNSTTYFAAISITGGRQSPCSTPVTYIEDSSPPHTRITMGPGAKTRQRKVTFRFADIGGDPVGTSFVCRVDSHRWKPCHSPFKLRHLDYKRHVLRVLGSDQIGNVESKAAKRSFKVIH
jgi:hypothetical protein